jgi:transposase
MSEDPFGTELFECKVERGARGVQNAELNGDVDSESNHGSLDKRMYCIGLDVHKKTISYCVKDTSGQIQQEGTIPATRTELDHWMKTLPNCSLLTAELTP